MAQEKMEGFFVLGGEIIQRNGGFMVTPRKKKKTPEAVIDSLMMCFVQT